MADAAFGRVVIDCPGCGRETTFPIYAEGPIRDGDELVTRLTLDMDAVAAHLLTHGQHDGEPLQVAA